MRYFVTIGDRTLEVDLGGEIPVVDGRPVAAELATLPGTAIRHLLVEGRSHTLVAHAGDEPGTWELQLAGRRLLATVVDERAQAIRAMTAQATGPKAPSPVRAPMPGLIVRVLVEPGQQVTAGQGVVSIEAMKMENELRAEAAGTVARVSVAIGQAVEKGAVLVEFEVEGAE
jgi:biotin carboxyl carrier protein